MLNRIIETVKEAGKIILSARDQESAVTAKEGKKNFVTMYDVAVQNFLFEELGKAFPEAEFVGEESENRLENDALRFIIDPIDGTTNFMQDYRCSCISVALCKENDILAGVVYNPYTDEIFSAEKGKGAYLNGKKIQVSDRPLSDGLALFGTSPYHPENTDETFALLRKVFDLSRDIRRSGSAAYDICMVACGRCEVFFEKALQPWDVAAGTLILKEAGGIALNYEGNEINFSMPNDVVFANPKAYKEFATLLQGNI
ncbi:MAG: inositol monophosphatase [Clostridia bacterium]|nr:inositol monophosphatase [Clostridia bacterium]MBP3442399.1 inositol monophosphatase [Clostridia bacterium]